MIDIELIVNKYDPKDYAVDYSHGSPIPWLYFDDFLPEDTLAAVQNDVKNMPSHMWSNFTRNDSMMKECNNLKYAKVIRDLVLNLNSSEFIEWLEEMTNHKKLIPDPLLIGAGLMRCGTGNSLKLHTDFNWNEQLNLNRRLNAILYISEEWDESWGGGLEFWNFERTECLHTVAPKSNRLLLWDYDKRLVHGHPIPLTCPKDTYRDGLRLFYFNSNATPEHQPHRSLYWTDKDGNPVDKKENL